MYLKKQEHEEHKEQKAEMFLLFLLFLQKKDIWSPPEAESEHRLWLAENPADLRHFQYGRKPETHFRV